MGNTNNHYHVWLRGEFTGTTLMLHRAGECFEGRQAANRLLKTLRGNGRDGEVRAVRRWEPCWRDAWE